MMQWEDCRCLQCGVEFQVESTSDKSDHCTICRLHHLARRVVGFYLDGDY